MIFKRSAESHPNIPPTFIFRWGETEGKYHPVMTGQLLPTPEATMKMSLCKCQKLICKSRRCVCTQIGFLCVALCC